MNTAIDHAATPSVRAFCKGKDGRKPPGTKTLQLFLPMQLYFHVQAQAALSQLEIRQYVGQFLVEAFPLSPPVLQQNADNSTALSAATRNDKLDGESTMRSMAVARTNPKVPEPKSGIFALNNHTKNVMSEG